MFSLRLFLALAPVALVASCVSDSVPTEKDAATTDTGTTTDSSPGTDTGVTDAPADAKQDAGDGAVVPPTWPPSSLTSNLVAWFDGDSNVTLAAGKVAAWGDKTTKGNSAGQSNASLQPVEGSAPLNGHKVLHFVACNQLQIADATSLQLGTTFTLATVIRYSNPGSGGGDIFQKQPSAVPYPGLFLTVTGTGTVASYVRSDQPVIQGPAGFNTAAHRAILRYNTTSLSLRYDGVDASVAVASTDTSAVGVKINIGAASATAECFIGDIAELVLINKSLSGPETDDLDAFYKSKYGL